MTNSIELLRAVRAAGGRVESDGERLVVDAPPETIADEVWANLADRKTEIVDLLAREADEIAMRVEAFARLVGADLSVPFLSIAGSPAGPGRCLSCGAEEPLQGSVRCDLCVRAAQIAVEQVIAKKNSGGSSVASGGSVPTVVDASFRKGELS